MTYEDDVRLYCDDGLRLLTEINGQQTDKTKKILKMCLKRYNFI